MHTATEHTLVRSYRPRTDADGARAVLTSGGGGARVPTVPSRAPHVRASLPCPPGRMPSTLRLRTLQQKGRHGPLKSVDADTQPPSAFIRGVGRGTGSGAGAGPSTAHTRTRVPPGSPVGLPDVLQKPTPAQDPVS